MPSLPLQRFNVTSGLNVSDAKIETDKSYLTVGLNAQYNRNNKGLEKRPGYQARIASKGGFGTFDYNQIDKDTGATTIEHLTADTKLWKRTNGTFTIHYSGSGQANISIRLNSGGTDFQFLAAVNGTNVLTYTLGVGFEEGTSITLANLKTQIDAISGGAWSATISGTTTIPAAFLPVQKDTPINPASPTVVLPTYEWNAINAPLDAFFQGSFDNRNNDDFINISSAQVNGCVYFANGYDETTKYDGQTHYRAGLPQLTAPTLTTVSSGGGTAQVTTITTIADAAIAEVRDILCVADTSTAEVFTITCTKTNHNQYQGNYIICYGWSGTIIESICIWFQTKTPGSTLDTQPAAGTNRYIEVDISSVSGTTNIATTIKNTIDADSAFSATSSTNVVTITNSFKGSRPAPSEVDSDNAFSVLVTTSGTDGLNQKWVTLYDENGSVAFWFDIIGGATEPSHGANRGVEVTGAASGNTAAQVATALKNTIDADSKFAASVSTATVTATNSTAGSVPDGSANDTGFTLTVTTQGVDALQGKYFILYDSDTTNVAFWYDVGNIGTPEPAHGATRGVEITTVTAGMTATQVATETELAIEADVFSSSSSTNVITATNNSVGLFPAPDAGTSGFTIEITTPGTNGGLGEVATFKYALVAKQKDAAGNEYTGEPTPLPNIAITTAATTDNVQIRFISILDTSGFNTGAAKVNGNQDDVTTITVESGHTLKVGDTAYFYDLNTNEFVERDVTAIAATTVTINGAAVKVLDNDILSNNLRIQILRTKAGGEDLYVVTEIPNNSIDGFTVFIDGHTDNQLLFPFLEQIQPHSLPPKGRFIASWGRQLVIAGKPDAPNELNLSFIGSDAASSEYYPAAYTYLAESKFGDVISGIAQNNEVFAVFKEKSIFIASGDPTVASIRVDPLVVGEIGCVAHHTIQQIDGALMWLDDDGVYGMSGGQMPVEISKLIRPLIVGNQGFTTGAYNLRKAVSFNERKLNRNYWVYLPVEAEAPNGDILPTSESRVMVFNYDRAGWLQWTALPLMGGITKVGDDVVFTERRFSSTLASTQMVHYFMLNSQSEYDYADNLAGIAWDVAPAWEDGGYPEIQKKWIKLKMFNTEPSFPSTFGLNVSVEADYLEDLPVSSWHWSIRTDISSTAAGRGIPRSYVQRLKGTKAYAARLRFQNSALYENPIINAYVIQLDGDSILEVHD